MYKTIPITGIYAIENRINGKIYIGQSKSIFKRWNSHVDMLLWGKHHNENMQMDYDQLKDITIFSFRILEQVPVNLLTQKETFYMMKMKREGKILYNAE